MDKQKTFLISVAVAVIVIGVSFFFFKKKEYFTHSQLLLNAKNYSFVPQGGCCNTSATRPNFASLTCNTSNIPNALKGMSAQQIKNEIDLHYKKPLQLVDAQQLLPDTDVSGLSYGIDPSEDFANKFVWHRTTHARLKRRNWEGGASMIRGDLIIDPGKQSWFQHDNDFRDLTPGFIPKQYCGQIDVEDLTYNMHKTV